MFDLALLTQAQEIASANWLVWSADFEHGGDPARIPTLTDRYRFCCFCRDYSVIRNGGSDVVEATRRALCDSDDFRAVAQDETGRALDQLAHRLPQIVPGLARERSLLSKLSAFARPDVFVAWDRFARRGAHYLAQPDRYPSRGAGEPLRTPREGYPYKSYADYLHDVRRLLATEAGEDIKQHVGDRGPQTGALVNRVLDCCLMIVGNRWPD